MVKQCLGFFYHITDVVVVVNAVLIVNILTESMVVLITHLDYQQGVHPFPYFSVLPL